VEGVLGERIAERLFGLFGLEGKGRSYFGYWRLNGLFGQRWGCKMRGGNVPVPYFLYLEAGAASINALTLAMLSSVASRSLIASYLFPLSVLTKKM
jgi:hypothetical protein